MFLRDNKFSMEKNVLAELNRCEGVKCVNSSTNKNKKGTFDIQDVKKAHTAFKR